MRARRGVVRRLPASVALTALVALVAMLLVPTGSLAATVPSPSAGSHVRPATLAVSGLGWTSVTPGLGPSPLLRSSGALAYDPLDGYAVLFGGCNRHLCPLGDTWKFESGLWTNLTASVSNAPSARQGEVLVNDPQDGYVLLFGGMGAGGVLGDSWKFVGGNWFPLVPTGTPSPRAFAMATYDPSLGVILYGGQDASGHVLSDTWSYMGGVWTNRSGLSALTPPARANAGFAFDALTGTSILFGGTTAPGLYLGDTWSYGPSGWASLSAQLSSAPSARANLTFTYDPGRSSVLLFGGWSGLALPDTWEYANGSWQSLSANLSISPGARYGAMATYYEDGGYLLLFGGTTAGGRYNTWLLLSPLNSMVAGPSSAVAPGVPVSFSSQVTGGLGPYNVSWQFGDGSSISGGTTATHTYPVVGTYTVVLSVTDAAGEVSTAQFSLSVRLAPLTVSIVPSSSSGQVGTPVKLTAEPSGGASPYTFAWSAPAGVCGDATAAALTCTPVSAGPLQVTVTVTEASGHSASTGFALPVSGPNGGSATTPAQPPTAPTLGTHSNAWTVLLPLAIALAAALTVGVVMYSAGRRRARAQLAHRPLCYAVPAWSETPPEFAPAPEPDDAVHGWGRE